MSTEVPFAATLSVAGAESRPYLAIDRAGVVRALVPADGGAMVRRALARTNGPESLARHLGRQAYACLSTTRLVAHRRTVQVADAELRERLSSLAGCDLRLAFQFGPLRANRKPVVLGYDADGALAVVAKIGATLLTAGLVRAEGVALRALAAEPDLPGRPAVPRLLGETDWAGAPMLVASALPMSSRHRQPSYVARASAERWIVRTCGPHDGFEAYLDDLRGRIARLPDPDLTGRWEDYLTEAARTLPPTLAMGSWHGDWSPQNVAVGASGLAAWDWERFAPNRPRGYDALHFRLQSLLRHGHARAGRRLMRGAPAVLRPWQELPPRQARALARLLLLEIGTRYEHDRQSSTGSPGAGVRTWIEDAVLADERSEP